MKELKGGKERKKCCYLPRNVPITHESSSLYINQNLKSSQNKPSSRRFMRKDHEISKKVHLEKEKMRKARKMGKYYRKSNLRIKAFPLRVPGRFQRI